MDRRRLAGIVLVLVSACAFGSGGLFAQPVYDTGLGWQSLSAWRFGFGALCAWLWCLGFAERRRGLRLLNRRTVGVAVLLGVLYTGNSGTYYAGLETVPVSLATLIVYIYPAVVAVLSLRYGRRLEGRRAWFALGLALVGVALALGGIPAGELPPISGLLLVIVSPLIYSVWIVLSARLAGERRESVGEEVDGGADAAAATALMMTGTAATYWLTGLATGVPLAPASIPAAAWSGSGSSRPSSPSRRSTQGPGGSAPPRPRSSAPSSRSTRSRLRRCCSARRSLRHRSSAGHSSSSGS